MVDKLVGDIYGEDYKGLGLSADTVVHTAAPAASAATPAAPASPASPATNVSRIHVVMCSHAASDVFSYCY